MRKSSQKFWFTVVPQNSREEITEISLTGSNYVKIENREKNLIVEAADGVTFQEKYLSGVSRTNLFSCV